MEKEKVYEKIRSGKLYTCDNEEIAADQSACLGTGAGILAARSNASQP